MCGESIGYVAEINVELEKRGWGEKNPPLARFNCKFKLQLNLISHHKLARNNSVRVAMQVVAWLLKQLCM
jgi:hypothetical protein